MEVSLNIMPKMPHENIRINWMYTKVTDYEVALELFYSLK